jgi:hypothetical protein
MTLREIRTYTVSAIVLAIGLQLLRNGYRRRRPYWTRDSWWRFAGVTGTGLVLLLLPIGAEVAVALGTLSRTGLSQDARSYWALGGIALMFVGAGVLVVTIRWFASGDPEQPFPGASDRRGPTPGDRYGSA